jgi:Family of unknown function (DUF5681)
MTKNPEDDEPVGYGHPPAHSRFQKGRSGNPAGRPRSKVSTILSKVLDEPVDLEGGGTCTRLELLMTTLATHAQSEERYMRLLLSQLDKIDRHASRTTAAEESPDASSETE